MVEFRVLALGSLILSTVAAVCLGPVGCGSFSNAEPGATPSSDASAADEAGDERDAGALNDAAPARSFDVVWAKSFGPSDDDGGGRVFGGSLAVRASGEIYATGTYVEASMVVATKTLPAPDSEDAFVIDLAGSGEVIDAHAYGAAGK